MNKYTVIIQRPSWIVDGPDSHYLAHEEADKPETAVFLAVLELLEADLAYDTRTEDYDVLYVFEGHFNSLYRCPGNEVVVTLDSQI